MKNIAILFVAIISVIGIESCANPTGLAQPIVSEEGTTSRVIVLADGTKVWAGYGANAVTGVFKSNEVLNYQVLFSNDPPRNDLNGNPEYEKTYGDIRYIEDSQDITNNLKWGLSLQVSNLGANVFDGSYDQTLNKKTDENSMTFIAFQHRYVGYYQSYNESLNPAALALLNTDPSSFISKYGDTFAKRSYLGGDVAYICTYRFIRNSSTDIRELKATFLLDLGNAFGMGGGGQLSNTQIDILSQTSITMQSYTDVTGFTPLTTFIASKADAKAILDSEAIRLTDYLTANAGSLPVVKTIFTPFSDVTANPNSTYNAYLGNVVNYMSWKGQWKSLRSRLQDILNTSSIVSVDLANKCVAAINGVDTEIGKLNRYDATSRAPVLNEYSNIFTQWNSEYAAWVASRMNIPLVVVLYSDTGYSGAKMIMVENETTFANRNYNDIASSALVYRGPSYSAYKLLHGGQEPSVTLYGNTDRTGQSVKLQVGGYPYFPSLGVNDCLSMASFDDSNSLSIATPTVDTDGTFTTVNTVVETYTDTGYGGSKRVYLAGSNLAASNVDCNSPGLMFCNDSISSIIVKNGTNGSGAQRVLFGKDSFPNVGATVNLGIGGYPVMGSYGFNDTITSVKFDN